MIKHKVLFLFAIVIAGLSLAAGQSSTVHATSANAGPDPAKVATKPLTPKSAMPAKSKSSMAAPATSAPKAGSKTDAELSRLERQPIKAANPNANKPAAKSPTVSKPVAVNANGSGINSTYQKPAINKP
jgi:uncharacterized iron-regulated membrane protein